MDIFRTSTAPYVLVLIVSAIGWYFGRITTEVESTRAASYYVETINGLRIATVRLTNVSRKEPLENLQFSLVCRAPPCFTENPRGQKGTFAHLNAVPPVAPSATRWVKLSPDEVTIITTLPAGGAVEIAANLAQPRSELLFYYLPSKDSPTHLYLYSGQTLFGWIVGSYLMILIVGFFGFGSILVIWLLLALWKYATQKPKEESNEPQRYHVTLSLAAADTDGGSATS